ncbi:unnamed protein product [Ixodes hexagonus]
MNEACLQRKSSHINTRILLLLPLWYSSSAAFKPEVSHYRTAREAVEYVAWQALREGRPPCVTLHPIGISLFCIMGQCMHDINGKPHCHCDQSFTGLTCSVYKGMCTSESLCAPHLCKDNLAKVSKFECVCKPGYYVPEDPAFSHCIPEETLQDSIGAEANGSHTAVSESEDSLIHTSWQENHSLSQSFTPITSEAEKNASGVGVLCASSDFLMCIIEPKEENKTVDTLFKKVLQSAFAQRKIDKNTERPRDSETEQQLPVTKDNDDSHANAATRDKAKGLGANMAEQQLPTHPNLQQLTIATSHNRTNVLKGHGQSPFIIQRRFSSTFQIQQIGICDKILLQTDNIIGERKNAESATETVDTTSAGAQQNNKRNEFSFSYKMNIQSVTKKSELKKESAGSKLYFQATNKDENDYEVVQFRTRTLQRKPKFTKDKYGKGTYSAFNRNLPAAYFIGAKARKAIEKSHLGNKVLPVETQDQIIDNLKHAVDVSENTKSNVINTSKVTYISNKLKSVVEINNEKGDDGPNGSGEQHFRTDFDKKLLSTEAEKTSASDGANIPSGRSQPTSRNGNTNSKTLGAEQLLSETGRVGHQQRIKVAIPLGSSSINGPTNLSFKDNLRLENGSNDQSHIMLPYVPFKTAEDSFPPDDEVNTEYPSPDTVAAEVDDEEVAQTDDDTTFTTEFSSLPADSAQRMTTSNKENHELERTTPKFAGPAILKHIAPQLIFNVTVLNREGKNMSSAWYLVPATGTKAILISWGMYSPDKT